MTAKEIRRFRNSSRWQKVRARQLRAEPWCRPRLTHTDKREAKQVDHIIPLHKGGHPTNPDNLQSICVPCHKRKTLSDTVKKKFVDFCPHGFPTNDPSGKWTCDICQT